VISVRDSRELQAATLALKAADKGLRTEINRATVKTIGPVWKSVVEANASRPMDMRMLAVGARVKGGNPAVAMAANSSRAIGRTKRLKPSKDYAGYEFGADRAAFSRYTRRSKKGGSHTVERRTMRHLPPRTRKGRVVYPAMADVAPRLTSLWVQLIVKKYNDAAEGKS